MTAVEILSSPVSVTMTSDLSREVEALLDRCLVAHFTGWARNEDGNGIRFAPAFDNGVLNTLAGRGLVRVERREIGSPLVWLTDAGHDVIDDIADEGGFGAHIAALRSHKI